MRLPAARALRTYSTLVFQSCLEDGSSVADEIILDKEAIVFIDLFNVIFARIELDLYKFTAVIAVFFQGLPSDCRSLAESGG